MEGLSSNNFLEPYLFSKILHAEGGTDFAFFLVDVFVTIAQLVLAGIKIPFTTAGTLASRFTFLSVCTISARHFGLSVTESRQRFSSSAMKRLFVILGEYVPETM